MDPTLIDHWFSNHPATAEQRQAYDRLWASARPFAQEVNTLVPEGADKTAAIRQLRQAVTAAITAIACHQENK